jgi:hypothetical protein
VVSGEEAALWLSLLDAAVRDEEDGAPLAAALLFLLLAGAQPVEVDGGITIVMGRMDPSGWQPLWRNIGHSLLGAVRLALVSLGDAP